MPLVSVIIPVFNQERFVGEAIECVLAQTMPDLEVIVIDDGSTDQTAAAVAAFGERVIYRRQSNQGPAAARNAGLSIASGKYVLFLDADDRIPPHKLTLQTARLESDPDVCLVYSGWRCISEDGQRVLSVTRPNRQGNLIKELLRRRFYLVTGAVVVRRASIDAVGVFDVSLKHAEDTDLWVRLANAGFAFGYVDELLFDYRTVPGSLSRNFADHEQHELARLDKFFADPALPGELLKVKSEAYAAIHYEYASKYYASGDIPSGKLQLAHAIMACPAMSVDTDWLLGWISGFALGPDVGKPQQFIRDFFQNLPAEGGHLIHLKRRALASYHIAAVFSAHQKSNLRSARAHILPAVAGDPRILLNRGFLRIAAQSMFA